MHASLPRILEGGQRRDAASKYSVAFSGRAVAAAARSVRRRMRDSSVVPTGAQASFLAFYAIFNHFSRSGRLARSYSFIMARPHERRISGETPRFANAFLRVLSKVREREPLIEPTPVP